MKNSFLELRENTSLSSKSSLPCGIGSTSSLAGGLVLRPAFVILLAVILTNFCLIEGWFLAR